MAIKKELLALLVCPKCKSKVRLTENEAALACEACALLYPIRDGIPVMLIEEAHSLPAMSDKNF
jgi:hypothetical protein